MKKRILSVFAVLILCLSLFLTGALAAEGTGTTVTIKNSDGTSVTLTAGKFYVINDNGGVTEQDTAPSVGSGSYDIIFYLTYAGNTLTLHSAGNGNNCGIYDISVNVTGGNLTITSDISDLAAFNFHMSDTFHLNGATLTLDVPVFYLEKATSDASPLIDSGKIAFANRQQGKLTLENNNGVIADALTIQNANSVALEGFTATGGVFSNALTVENCGSVTITQTNPANPVVIDDDKITKDENSTINTVRTELDISQFDFTEMQAILDTLEPDTPIQYKAGDGSISFQKTADNKIKMALDNATVAGNRELLIGTLDDLGNPNLKDVIIEVKGDNTLPRLMAQSITLTGDSGSSLTGALWTVGGEFKNNSSCDLNALVTLMPSLDAQGTITVYGKADLSTLIPDNSSVSFNDRQLIVSEGATLIIPSGYTLAIPLDCFPDNSASRAANPPIIKKGGKIVNDGTIELTGATASSDFTDEQIKEIITKTLKLEGSGVVEVPVDGSDTKYYDIESGDPLTAITSDLNFSGSTPSPSPLPDGVTWDDTSKTLTLNDCIITGAVTLPDDTVTIKTTGNCRIGKLSAGDSPQNAHLIFNGKGTLTVEQQMNISGGDSLSLTVGEGATVTSLGGIYIGASGGVNSTVTVNGNLQINSKSTALSAGSIVVGSEGVLEVSGGQGVQLNGMPKNSDHYKNIFTVESDDNNHSGRFTADCSGYPITVTATDIDNITVEILESMIANPQVYLPTGCEMGIYKYNDGTSKIICLLKDGKPYTGALTIHQYHEWDETKWAPGLGGIYHYHPCTFEGCDKLQPNSEEPHEYDNASDSICNQCGYKRLMYVITVSATNAEGGAAGASTVTVAPSSLVAEGTEITLAPAPDEGYRLKSLTVTQNDGTQITTTENNDIYTFIMPANAVTIHAVFERVYAVTVTQPVEGGSISANKASAVAGEPVILNATANTGWQFEKWQVTSDFDSAIQSVNNNQFTMPADNVTVTAMFEKIPYNVTVQAEPSEGGAVTAYPSTATVGDTITLTNEPAEGYRFLRWEVKSNSGAITVDNNTFSMPADNVTVKAIFVDESVSTYTVTVESNDGGTAKANLSSAAEGTHVRLNVTPDTGYRFKEWQVESSSPVDIAGDVSTGFTFTMPGHAITVTAIFVKDSGESEEDSTYSVTADAAFGEIEISPNPAKAGETVALTPKPNDGYHLESLIVTDSEGKSIETTPTTDGKYTFIMPANAVTVKAIFEANSYAITVDRNIEDGTVDINPESAKAGETVTLTATPNSGYHFKKWNVVSGDVTLDDKTKNPITFIMPAGDVKIEAVFEKDSVPSRPSGGGGGSGSSSSSDYSITIEQSEHGKVTSNRLNAGRGTAVTLTVTPDDGYQMKSLTVTDSRNNAIQLTDQGGGKYTFTMPSGAIKVKAVFEPLPESSKPDGGAANLYNTYTDLDPDAWYYEAVNYVLENGLMKGYGGATFAPNDTLSRAQFVQILYNKEGKPAVTGGAAFTDVTSDAWYADAVAWAVSKGIVNGYSDGRFGPDDKITREQLAVMFWRYVGKPAVSNKELRFTDAGKVADYALDALCWAVENGVINGKDNNVLDPQGLATRAQTAQILKNFFDK